MSEPAKDEAELMERVAEALYDNYDLDLPMSFTLAAIRAAGWAVVPQTELDALHAENARLREALSNIAANAAVPGFEPEQRHAIWRMAREALDSDGQKARRAKALAELAEIDADLLDIDPEIKS